MAHEPLQTFLHFLRWCSRSRSLRLTPDGFGFVLLALALGIAALNTGNNLLYLLLAMMLSLIIVSGVLSEKCLRNLALSRRMPPHLFAGQRGIAVLRVANEKAGFPSCSLTLTDVGDGVSGNSALHLLHLPPQAAIMQSYALLFPRR